MHVIGVECHESGRIDRQLLGRAGRQGDPGSGRFFVSADDPLLVRFAPRLSKRMRRMPNRQGEIDVDLSREVLVAQRAAETAAFTGATADARARPLDGRDGEDAELIVSLGIIRHIRFVWPACPPAYSTQTNIFRLSLQIRALRVDTSKEHLDA